MSMPHRQFLQVLAVWATSGMAIFSKKALAGDANFSNLPCSLLLGNGHTWVPLGGDVTGAPIWDVVAGYARDVRVVRPVRLNLPRVIGMEGNREMAA